MFTLNGLQGVNTMQFPKALSCALFLMSVGCTNQPKPSVSRDMAKMILPATIAKQVCEDGQWPWIKSCFQTTVDQCRAAMQEQVIFCVDQVADEFPAGSEAPSKDTMAKIGKCTASGYMVSQKAIFKQTPQCLSDLANPVVLPKQAAPKRAAKKE